jgi:hypothetical protein
MNLKKLNEDEQRLFALGDLEGYKLIDQIEDFDTLYKDSVSA